MGVDCVVSMHVIAKWSEELSPSHKIFTALGEPYRVKQQSSQANYNES